MSAPLRAPSPEEDDSAPLLLRCIVSRYGFRRLADYRPGGPAFRDEIQLYVWPTTTLREIAQLLYMADPELSHALAPHGFRIVFYDQASGRHEARSPVVGVQRVSNEHLDALLQPLPESEHEESQDVHALLRSVDRQNRRFKEHPSEVAARRTLQDLDLAVGDLLECATDMSEADRARPMPAHGGESRRPPRRYGPPLRA